MNGSLLNVKAVYLKFRWLVAPHIYALFDFIIRHFLKYLRKLWAVSVFFYSQLFFYKSMQGLDKIMETLQILYTFLY
jgi:hypothetical protein